MTGNGQRGGQRTRKGTDPEGGERSAWKGFVGPSGLGLDHALIPSIEKKVYDVLLPLVFRAEHPIPLSQFTQAACDVLLPVLPSSSRELTEHAFKSQWGRLNEFVCPRLAELRGLGDCGFNRADKTVQLSIATDPPPGFTPRAGSGGAAGGGAFEPGAEAEGGRRRRERGARGGGGRGEPAADSGSASAAAAAPAKHGGAAAAVGGMPVPAALSAAVQQGPSTSLPPQPAAAQPPACVYCGQAFHVMKQCPDFHTMLNSIYQAGYQQGAAAAQQTQQAYQPQLVAAAQPVAGQPAVPPVQVTYR